MSLKSGLNSIDQQGVFVDDTSNALYEYKVFHIDINHPTSLIFTNLRTGKTYGPILLPDDTETISDAVYKVLKERANELYPNI
ncbi:hypothetical protein [Bacillus sp. NP247]|uniref:hypothetical protein n=1 Tax=Bacillus sp. NP247 TaxID=2846779 RepID=UPI001C631F02|nr:hypothetical protein [Bacillus sp. NP247]QWU46380.1 hypothetical protein KPL75_05435 [Bacillus sp. NP247]